jgi:ABC-type polysaccharide transport system permease subunit
MNKFVTVLSLAVTKTLTMTSGFPAIIIIFIIINIIQDTITVGSLNFKVMLVQIASEDVLLVGNNNWFSLLLKNDSIWSSDTRRLTYLIFFVLII